MSKKLYSLPELLSRLNLDYDADRGKMDCFNCGKRRKINLDFEKNRWRCPSCHISGGVLDMFAIHQLGYELEKKAPKETLKEVTVKLDQFMDGGSYTIVPIQIPERPKVKVAADDMLNAVYSAMLDIPALQLLPHHRENLHNRGLSDDVIERNGYRSIPEKTRLPDCYTTMYEQNGGEVRRQGSINWISAFQVKFGLMIADTLICKGLSLQGIPGFYKFGNLWCYWSNPGMLIPTRNLRGQIVIWQVRRDKLQRKDDAKYITVSAKSLPGHVTENVSRSHFPIGNAPLSKETPVLVTEGPLKADIASHLYGQPAVFAAIPGISTTTDLLSNCRTFKKHGIRVLQNALDMDRLTNPNVRKGVKSLVDELKKRDMKFQDLFWDEPYALSKLLGMLQVAKLRQVPVPIFTHESVFFQLNAVCAALNAAGINLCIVEQGKTKKHYYWDPDTKGIDDYLLHR